MRAPWFIAEWALALLSASCLFSQSTPKDKPADYPSHVTSGDIAIAGEYLMHSIPAGNQTFFASDYLVIEVAVFPASGTAVEIGTLTFGLRLNGRKQLLYPDSPGFVAASVKYPDWEQRVTTEAQAGVGGVDVTVGRPPVVGRFPGDPTPDQTRMPRAPKAPPPDERRGIEQEEPVRAEDAIAAKALPEGRVVKPVAGYLYFRYKGKTKSIKSVELLYETSPEPVILKLM